MKPEPLNIQIGRIMTVMQKELSDAWERYEGAELDDLDDYGELYENAYHKATQQLTKLFEQLCEEVINVGGLPEMKYDHDSHLEYEFRNGYNEALKECTQILEEQRKTLQRMIGGK